MRAVQSQNTIFQFFACISRGWRQLERGWQAVVISSMILITIIIFEVYIPW